MSVPLEIYKKDSLLSLRVRSLLSGGAFRFFFLNFEQSNRFDCTGTHLIASFFSFSNLLFGMV